MTRSEQVFLLILILNTMVAIGYLICCMVRNGWKAPRRKEYWIKTDHLPACGTGIFSGRVVCVLSAFSSGCGLGGRCVFQGTRGDAPEGG